MSEPCLLLDMPAEVRNTIYEFAFAPDNDNGVPLFEAKPPTNDALVRTCRQIHNEANEFFNDSRREYFRNTKFCITGQMTRNDSFEIPDLPWSPTDIDSITRLEFRMTYPNRRTDDTIELADKRGGWKRTMTNRADKSTYVCYIVLKMAVEEIEGADPEYSHSMSISGTKEAMKAELTAEDMHLDFMEQLKAIAYWLPWFA